MNFRRHYTPRNLVFITQVVDDRYPAFAQPDALALLSQVLHTAKALYPFAMLGYVFLPDHLHLLIRTEHDVSPASVMRSFKRAFTHDYKLLRGIDGSMRFWQPRYWDHIIRDEEDLERHLAYIHYNPVKHGYVPHPEDWPHSSYLWWLEHGYYPKYWGWQTPEVLAQRAAS